MRAICPAGPPKLMKPSFTQKRSAVEKGTDKLVPGGESGEEIGDIPHFLAKGDRPAASLSPFAREAGK
jgi:hypothetical protein